MVVVRKLTAMPIVCFLWKNSFWMSGVCYQDVPLVGLQDTNVTIYKWTSSDFMYLPVIPICCFFSSSPACLENKGTVLRPWHVSCLPALPTLMTFAASGTHLPCPQLRLHRHVLSPVERCGCLCASVESQGIYFLWFPLWCGCTSPHPADWNPSIFRHFISSPTARSILNSHYLMYSPVH